MVSMVVQVSVRWSEPCHRHSCFQGSMGVLQEWLAAYHCNVCTLTIYDGLGTNFKVSVCRYLMLNAVDTHPY